jgi:hypothetical protein
MSEKFMAIGLDIIIILFFSFAKMSIKWYKILIIICYIFLQGLEKGLKSINIYLRVNLPKITINIIDGFIAFLTPSSFIMK